MNESESTPFPPGPTTPMPVPVAGAEVPKFLVLFGGTFDPPHRGHVELPIRVRDELERRLECPGGGMIVYVPAARSPHKAHGPVASNADRVEMLRRALAGVDRAEVWTDEVDRAAAAAGGDGEASFTVDTITRARDWLGAALGERAPAMRLLIGADQAVNFHRWRAPREIVRLAPPVVMVRGDLEESGGLGSRMRSSRFWSRDELDSWRESLVPVGRIDVSATAVRDALSRQDYGEAGRWLAPGVVELIRERGLYQRPE